MYLLSLDNTSYQPYKLHIPSGKQRKMYFPPRVGYWTLPDHRSESKSPIPGESKERARWLLLKRGIPAPERNKVTLNRLRTLLNRSERGLLYYDKYSIEELKSFVDGRSLTYPKRSRRTKNSVIAMLEAADDEPRFEKMLDLPAELRVRIYELYFANFGQIVESDDGRGMVPLYYHQPPITTASRLLRQESFNIFFDVCSLHLDFGVVMTNIRPPPVLSGEPSVESAIVLAKAVNRFKHWHIRIFSLFTTIYAQIRLPRVPAQAGALISLGCVSPMSGRLGWPQPVLPDMAARKVEKDLEAIVKAVAERGKFIEWRVQDFEDMARVLKVIWAAC